MGKKTTIKLKDLAGILEELPTRLIEDPCDAWGCVTPHYRHMIDPLQVMEAVNKFLENDI